MKYELKGQSAIEYLMTYGWMLLVVAIVGGAVFSVVGDQSIESVSGFDSQSVNIGDFGVSIENGLMFSMNDPIGQTIVTEVTVSNPDNSNITYILNQDISEQNAVNLPGIISSDNDNELEVEITYDSSDLENLTTSGTVTGEIEIDENFNDRTMIMDGLVGYWSMDEIYSLDDRVYDLSGTNSYGFMQNNPIVEEGLVNSDGNAIRFERDSNFEQQVHVETSDIPAGTATVSAWLKHTGETTDESWALFSYGDSWDDPGGFFAWSSSTSDAIDRIRIDSFDDDGERYSGSYANLAGTDVNHIVCVVDTENNEFRLYINGELREVDSGMFRGQQKGDFTIGDLRGLSDYTGDKIVDDVHYYNRALSKEEIEIIYQQKKSLD